MVVERPSDALFRPGTNDARCRVEYALADARDSHGAADP